jgi:hypothetical protein
MHFGLVTMVVNIRLDAQPQEARSLPILKADRDRVTKMRIGAGNCNLDQSRGWLSLEDGRLQLTRTGAYDVERKIQLQHIHPRLPQQT